MAHPISAWENLYLLESTDLQQLDEIHKVIREQLLSERSPVLVNNLVDHYLETNSEQAMLILCMVQEPHDMHLLDKINECLGKAATRLTTLTLLGHVTRRQPTWKHKLSETPVLQSLLKCLKTDTDVVILTTAVLVLITMLPMIPQSATEHLNELFDIFARLSAWCLKNPGHAAEPCLVHLHAGVYALFHRLYGMYPCNLVSFLRSHYSMKENLETYEEIVKPMMEHVRIHPELVSSSTQNELDPGRWKTLETHDIVVECAKISLDPNEASYEEGYSPLSERLRYRQQQAASSPYFDISGSNSSTPYFNPNFCPPGPLVHHIGSEDQDVIWSPSTICGLTTPPKSPISLQPDASSSASHPGRALGTPSSQGTPMGTPATSPPPAPNTDDSTPAGSTAPGKNDVSDQEKLKLQLNKGEKGSDRTPKVVRISDLPEVVMEMSASHSNAEEAAISQELSQITTEPDRDPGAHFAGFDSPLCFLSSDGQTDCQRRSSCHMTQTPDNPPEPANPPPPANKESCNGSQDSSKQAFTPIEPPNGRENDNSGKTQTTNSRNILTPSPCKSQARCRSCFNPVPYEHLFELALPKTASYFISKKTEELYKKFKGSNEEAEEESTSVSPAEVLDRLIHLGADAHTKELNKLPLPSKSADWTHFGGSPPTDEINTLKNQLVLLHNQLLYERFKRQQHAMRNRRLLRKVIKVTALEEQNAALENLLRMQERDMEAVKQSLVQEQVRLKKLQEERSTVVTELQSQVQQLQKEREEFYNQSQELQTKLEDSQTRIATLQSELKISNHKVCNTEMKLNVVSQQLSNSESLQHQMEFLNRQLLVLGEVNQLYVQQLQNKNTNADKEVEMLNASFKKELDKARCVIVQQGQRMEGTQRRIAELEVQMGKKEILIQEQKKFLEDVKVKNRGQIQAVESKYNAQKKINQVLEVELLHLYNQLERQGLVKKRTPEKAETAEVAEERSNEDSVVVSSPDSPNQEELNVSNGGSGAAVNTSPQSSSGSSSGSSSNRSNSSEPSPERGADLQLGFRELLELPRSGPLTVGSYPNAKSLLGIRARELFRNKSESHCDEQGISSLSEFLRTELCEERGAEAGPSPASNAASPSVRDLQIMDYD